jgi:hypothetical protein
MRARGGPWSPTADVRLDVAWQSDAERHVRYLEVCEALKRVSTRCANDWEARSSRRSA